MTDNLPGDNEAKPRRGSRLSPRNMAMNLLARREHSQLELRDKLAKREVSADLIEATVTALIADGLQSDDRFAEAFVASRVRTGKGPVRIRMELNRRGVNDDLIALHVDAAGLEWGRLAREVRHKKFGAAVPSEYKEKARQMRFLEYRGFSGAHIGAALGDDFD